MIVSNNSKRIQVPTIILLNKVLFSLFLLLLFYFSSSASVTLWIILCISKSPQITVVQLLNFSVVSVNRLLSWYCVRARLVTFTLTIIFLSAENRVDCRRLKYRFRCRKWQMHSKMSPRILFRGRCDLFLSYTNL